MIRSSIAAFATIVVAMFCLSWPQQSERYALPRAESAPPVEYDILPVPSMSPVASVQSTCPGGVCPVPTAAPIRTTAVSVVSAPVRIVRSHWSYPGEIRSHLATDHGVDATGMTRDQAESLHDQLHESGTVAQASTVSYVARQPIRNTMCGIARVQPVRSVVRSVTRAQPVRNAIRGVGRVVFFRRCR